MVGCEFQGSIEHDTVHATASREGYLRSMPPGPLPAFPQIHDAQGLAEVMISPSHPRAGRCDRSAALVLTHLRKWYPDCFRKRQPALDPSASHEVWAQGRHSNIADLRRWMIARLYAQAIPRPRGFACINDTCARSPSVGRVAFDGFSQNRNHGVNVAHNAVVGVVEDQGLVIFVHGHDDLRGAATVCCTCPDIPTDVQRGLVLAPERPTRRFSASHSQSHRLLVQPSSARKAAQNASPLPGLFGAKARPMQTKRSAASRLTAAPSLAFVSTSLTADGVRLKAGVTTVPAPPLRPLSQSLGHDGKDFHVGAHSLTSHGGAAICERAATSSPSSGSQVDVSLAPAPSFVPGARLFTRRVEPIMM